MTFLDCLCTMNVRLIYSANKDRDLTIPQRRRPWKRHWKIDSASFQTISPFSQVPLLLKRREFRLELKRGAAPEFRKKPKIWSFHVALVQRRQRNVRKSVMNVQSCCFAIYYFLTLLLPSSDGLVQRPLAKMFVQVVIVPVLEAKANISAWSPTNNRQDHCSYYYLYLFVIYV